MSKKISWSQFKLEPSKPNLISGWDIFTFTGIDKPNLIENGWDDFEPYGSGKNYVDNWGFEGGMDVWNNYPKTKDNTVLVDENTRWSCRQSLNLDKDTYILRAKVDSSEETSRISISKPNEEFKEDFYFRTKGLEVVEFEFETPYPIDDIRIHLMSAGEFHWIQITPVDNQHLVVEKTPLGNGLTRIQTWGGRTTMKLIHRSKNTDDYVTKSLYLDNINDKPVRIDPNNYGEPDIVNGNMSKYVVITGRRIDPIAQNQFKIRTVEINDNLDFIASDPEIVEAKHPNIKVHMNQENTLMHIKTFGGNDKRKLYGTIGRFPSGSRFQQSIYIENYGDDVYVSGHTGTVERHKVETGFKGWMHFPSWVDGVSWMDFSFGAETPDKCLDFKCTLPQIVEGDVPNPELVVQTLEDGREHVRVFGASPNTKLVYDEAGFKGELYSFKTEIENQGTHLKMKSSIGDYEEVIDEGAKEIKHEGNLNSAKVEFEVGATDE